MMLSILVVNPGSSSLKLSVVTAAEGKAAHERELEAPDGRVDEAALRGFLDGAGPIDAVGVRVVHGGAEFSTSTRVDAAVIARIDALAGLAPLHNPPAATALRVLLRHLPRHPVVACFDTAFHASLPAAAATYAIPWEWTERWAIRRYGFHGLSHAYASRRAAELVGRPLGRLGTVTCHLGAGASLAAVQGGVSVDTTMGFTPLEGLVMATRSGSVDPGLLLWLQREAGMGPGALERALERESGLLGLSGVSGDMRAVAAAAEHHQGRARLALDVYGHRLCAGIGAMAVSLHRFDALVFTGGVGEHDAAVRARVCARLGLLGVPATLDDPEAGRDAVISPQGAAVAVLVVHAREDLEIAREVRRVLGSAPPSTP
ncbi:MAG TPA: acetate/propionate family kinase [Candidatus Dormibacteraeota bacterium]